MTKILNWCVSIMYPDIKQENWLTGYSTTTSPNTAR